MDKLSNRDAYVALMQSVGISSELSTRFADSYNYPDMKLEDSGESSVSARGEGEVLVNGPIVGNSTAEFIRAFVGPDSATSPAQFTKDLREASKESPDQVVVRINSPGGETSEAGMIYNRMMESETPIRIVVDGLSASASTLLHFATDDVQVTPLSEVMIHNAHFNGLNANKLRMMAKHLDKTSSQAADVYAKRMKPSAVGADSVESLMLGEEGEDGTTFTPQEAVDVGLATSLVELPQSNDSIGELSAENRQVLADIWVNSLKRKAQLSQLGLDIDSDLINDHLTSS